MLSKKVVKDIQSLSLKKHREACGLFVAEGPTFVSELIQAVPQNIEAVYALQEWSQKSPAFKKVIEVSEMELSRITSLKTPNKVLAVVKQFKPVPPSANDNLCIYLDTIKDPGNLGTIIRIADWFGITNIICSLGCADVYNPKVVQATMASIARVNVWYDSDDTWLSKQTSPLYAAALEGKSVHHFSKIKKGVLLIGNESKGLRESLVTMATQKVTIPRVGHAESLNAAVATGIILSHFVSTGNG